MQKSAYRDWSYLYNQDTTKNITENDFENGFENGFMRT